MTTYLVRPARPTDGVAVRRLAQAVRREFRVASQRDPGSPAGFDEFLWVVETGRGEIVGSCGAREGDGGAWELHSLNLTSEWRGFGLGRALVEEALRAAQASGALAVGCSVAPEFVEAAALLVRLGFVAAGSPDGEGRVRFVRTFGRAS